MSAIAVGDKVMLVYANCPHMVTLIGTIAVVESVCEAFAYCIYCDARSQLGPHADVRGDHALKVAPLSWLKKIEPDAEVQTTEREALVT